MDTRVDQNLVATISYSFLELTLTRDSFFLSSSNRFQPQQLRFDDSQFSSPLHPVSCNVLRNLPNDRSHGYVPWIATSWSRRTRMTRCNAVIGVSRCCMYGLSWIEDIKTQQWNVCFNRGRLSRLRVMGSRCVREIRYMSALHGQLADDIVRRLTSISMIAGKRRFSFSRWFDDVWICAKRYEACENDQL